VKLVRRAAVLCVVALLAQGTGCVRIYQPLRGLNTPVVIDTQVGNLTGVRLTVHCVPGDMLDRLSADELCRKVGVVFENQGATVTTISTLSGAEGDIGDAPETAAEPIPETDLLLELRARKIHQAKNPMLWMLCVASLTVVPASTEYTFAQDVVIRDGTGFLLAQETLQGRIVQQFGIASWLGNAVLDAFWRAPEDELTGEAMSHDLSTDLYRQLSQTVFNAKMQWLVLQQTPPVPGRK
jgi:hypothetical protein